jgi:hypothetical protein
MEGYKTLFKFDKDDIIKKEKVYYVNHTRKEIIKENNNIFEVLDIFPEYQWNKNEIIQVGYDSDDIHIFIVKNDYELINIENVNKMKIINNLFDQLNQCVKNNDINCLNTLHLLNDIKYPDYVNYIHTIINREDDENNTLLMISCENGNTEMATKLIKFKADVNYRNKNGRSVFNCAVSSGNIETMTLITDLMETI